jgi:kynurenine formamidase
MNALRLLVLTGIAGAACGCVTVRTSESKEIRETVYEPSFSAELLNEKGRWIDLTHEFSFETIYWPTANGFEHTVDFKGITDKGYFYASFEYKASEHGGTHLDAPIHFAKDRMTTEKIPLRKLIGPGVVVDVADKAHSDYLVTVVDLTEWEKTHGRIPNGSILLLNTGWHRRWPDRLKYLGTDEQGPEAVPKLHFPGLDPAAARWLVAKRRIAAVGLDTASIDYGQSTLFESHRELFKSNIPAFENVANLSVLPPTGSLVVALPMKIKGGSGGPLRIVAWVPTE